MRGFTPFRRGDRKFLVFRNGLVGHGILGILRNFWRCISTGPFDRIEITESPPVRKILRSSQYQSENGGLLFVPA